MFQSTLQPGTSLCGGTYRVERLLGSGGFGNVYLATDAGGTKYAIKEVFDRTRVQRASNGCDVLAVAMPESAAMVHSHQCRGAHSEALQFAAPALHHRNLVRILRCFDEFGTAFLVMPYINGKSLADAIAMPLARNTTWRLTVLGQIAAALECLHRNGLIHRDLKPDNLLIVGTDALPMPILLDTGAARGYGNPNNLHTNIVTDFGAPEIVSDVEERLYGKPGPATDCFALAGIAFLIFSGVKPIGYGQRVALQHAQGVDPLGQPSSMDGAVWHVLQQSLCLSVAARHQSASALVDALVGALSQPATMRSVDAAATLVPRLALPTVPAPAPPPQQNRTAAWVLALCLTVAACLALWSVSEPGWGASSCTAFLVVHLLLAGGALRRGAPMAVALTPLLNLGVGRGRE
jgi:serine/threonine protein kinase